MFVQAEVGSRGAPESRCLGDADDRHVLPCVSGCVLGVCWGVFLVCVAVCATGGSAVVAAVCAAVCAWCVLRGVLGVFCGVCLGWLLDVSVAYG